MRELLFRFAKRTLPRRLVDRLRVGYQQTANWLRYGDRHFFLSVTLEVSVYCNRTCSYCPNAHNVTPREFMSPEVFDLALHRLQELKWRGIVDFIFYNEPLLDPLLPEKVRRVKAAVPGSLPRITTNGDALTEELADELIDVGVVAFYVTRHVPHKSGWDERVGRVASRWPGRVTISDIQQIERDIGLWNRAGLVKVAKEYKTAACHAPEGALTIDRNGKVLLCCCDYFHKNVMGDIHEDSLRDIWASAQFARVRAGLARGVPLLEICRNCILRVGG